MVYTIWLYPLFEGVQSFLFFRPRTSDNIRQGNRKQKKGKIQLLQPKHA